jgi:hypothetical protein
MPRLSAVGISGLQAREDVNSNLDFGEWGDAFAANKMLGAAVQLALDIGITAAQDWCANQVHVAQRTWQSWEYSDRAMPPGLWELLLIKLTIRI